MTGFDAIEKVKTELDNAGLDLAGGIYMFSKPAHKDEPEFIEINTLALTHRILQKCNVNVNIYAKDIIVGTPDNGRLKALTEQVVSFLPVSRTNENIHIFLKDTDIIPDIDNNRHYVNMRLEVMMLNE